MCALQYVSSSQKSLIHSDFLVTAVTHNHSNKPINMFPVFQNIWTASAASVQHIIVTDSAVNTAYPLTPYSLSNLENMHLTRDYPVLHRLHPPDHYFC